MTDLAKLKELAELASKATPGPWWIDSHGHCMVSESQGHQTIFLTSNSMGPATRNPETGNLSHWPNDWDASYIASADPTTILAMIAEVERLNAENEALRERASYWKQRAKTAEGHLFSSDTRVASKALHARTAHADIPWEDLTDVQRMRMEGAAFAVIAAVNAERDRRKPHECKGAAMEGGGS